MRSLLLSICLCFVGTLQAGETKTLCIWDPVGANGPVYSFFFDLPVKAMAWGIDLKMKPYVDELLAVEDLKSGTCDMAVMTAILARELIPYAGSLDAVGAIRNDRQLQIVLRALTSAKAGVLLSHGDFESVGLLPVGSMYAFVDDRRINSVRAFRRKRIAMLNDDVQIRTMAKMVKAKPISTTVSNFAEKFHAGSVDVVIMPALAYKAFELDKVLRRGGGILDARLFNGFLQIIARKREFSDSFGEQMRRYILSRSKDIFKLIEIAERDIPDYYWIQTSEQEQDELEWLLKDTRLQLKFEKKLDHRALSFLWKIRCLADPLELECVEPDPQNPLKLAAVN